jgi:hypothetical protein
MKKLFTISILILFGCSVNPYKRLTPTQRIARQISNQYKELGMKDSADYWMKVSKQ